MRWSQEDDEVRNLGRARSRSAEAAAHSPCSPSLASITETRLLGAAEPATALQLEQRRDISATEEHPPTAVPYNDNGLKYWMSLTEGPGLCDPDAPGLQEIRDDDGAIDSRVPAPSRVSNAIETSLGTILQPISPNSVITIGTSYTASVNSVPAHSGSSRLSGNTAERDSVSEHERDNRPNSAHNFGDVLTTRLATRQGTFQVAEDGQVRYFGASSNLHLLHNGPFSLCQPKIASARGHEEMANLNPTEEFSRNQKYRDHLTELFFSWENPLLNAVDRTIYWSERSRYRLGEDVLFYSPTLETAM